MPKDRNRRRLTPAAAAALLLVFAAAWTALSLTEDHPGWLVVEAPETAVVGQPLEIRVTLKKTPEPAQIDCTLHHANADRKGWGYLASSGPAQPAAKGRTYSFVFTVPDHEDTAYAFAIVYLSPTGKWQDGTQAVSTKYMPFTRSTTAAASLGLRKTRVYRYPTAAEAAKAKAKGVRPRGRPSVWVHPVLGTLLLAAAVLSAIRARRSREAGPQGETGEWAVWLAFAVLLAVSAVVELSGIAGHLTAWGRRLAEEQGVYELRRPAQKAIMAALAAACLGLFILFIRAVRRAGSHRFLWWSGIGLAAYLALSFVSVLSFHAVDVVRNVVWHGVSPVDAVRGAGAMVTLMSTLLSLRPRAGRKTI
jgi:hypothetical protein